MTIYAINGSPRKNRNTATLLQAALDGARNAAPHVATELIHLSELEYRGCVSCFQCKRLGGRSYGRCAVSDALTPIMDKLAAADGIIFGSPIYFGGITGKLHSFLERLLFQYVVYDTAYSSLAPKKMPTAFIYTMNVSQEQMETVGYAQALSFMANAVGRVFSPPRLLYAWNTYQFDDYSKYKMEMFSEADKRAYRDRQWPLDCRAAAEIGAAMAS